MKTRIIISILFSLISLSTFSQDTMYIYFQGGAKSKIAVNTIDSIKFAPLQILLPSIKTQPQNKTVTEGNTAKFSIEAIGFGLEYQWQKNGVDIPGADKSEYTTNVLGLSDNGNLYRCVVTNPKGSVNSNTALLSVEPTVKIDVDPTDFILKVGKVKDNDAEQILTNMNGTTVSPYWNNWQGDYIEMTVAKNAYLPNSFTGDDDAKLIVKAAAGTNGMFFNIQIFDDTLKTDDLLDLLFDTLSSDDIMNANPMDFYIQPSWYWTLTYYSIQYQFPISYSAAKDYGVNYFSGSAMAYDANDKKELEDGYGIKIKHINAANSKIMEIFIPWNWIGLDVVHKNLKKGRRFAFLAGYVDYDYLGTTPEPKPNALYWKRFSPFHSDNGDYADSWGDIELVEDIK